MEDDQLPGAALGFHTRLSHLGRTGRETLGFVNPPVMRGSTVLYPTMADRRAGMTKRYDQALGTASWAAAPIMRWRTSSRPWKEARAARSSARAWPRSRRRCSRS